MFICDDPDAKLPLGNMPNQFRLGVNILESYLAPYVKQGLKSVILFGVPERKPKVSLFSLAELCSER